MPRTRRKAEKRNKVVYERGKTKSSGPKNKLISPLRNTIAHKEEISASMTILKPFSASNARTSFHQITEKLKLRRTLWDHLTQHHLLKQSAKAGCLVQRVTGTPCSQTLILWLTQLTSFYNASSHSLWASGLRIHSISLIIRDLKVLWTK